MITRDQVRELLDSARGREDRALVVLGGRASVIPVAELGTARYAGALEVVTGAELAKSVPGAPPTDADLDRLAATLETTVAELGG